MTELLALVTGLLGGLVLYHWIARSKYQRLNELETELVRLEEQLKSEKLVGSQSIETQKNQFQELQKQTQAQFELLAQKILEDKSKVLTEQSHQQLGMLLGPVKEQLQVFEKAIGDKFITEAKERYMLKGEIERLVQMHDKMAVEAGALTRALKGDNKFQGDWGELVLEKILESSGLRVGEEYLVQASFQSAEGERLRPDVVIKLPENKHIIIDSKVSLKAFEAFQNAENDMVQETMLAEHLRSIETHVQQLSSKKYAEIEGLESPDFVFMFIPVEPAWLLALRGRPELGAWAWDKGVAIVTASTLFTSLRTVANLWRFERQNKNAEKIAKEAGNLYDKFVGFAEEFDKVESQISTLQSTFETAKNRLISGKGNIVTRIEKLKHLGAKASKKIKGEWLEEEDKPSDALESLEVASPTDELPRAEVED